MKLSNKVLELLFEEITVNKLPLELLKAKYSREEAMKNCTCEKCPSCSMKTAEPTKPVILNALPTPKVKKPKSVKVKPQEPKFKSIVVVDPLKSL